MRSLRHWKTLAPDDAASLIRDDATLAVGWFGDALAAAVADAFVRHRQPRGLTIVYAETQGLERTRGLNRLAREGLVRRVIGGQWHPVPALHALALAGRIEAYSLPASMISRLFSDIADGQQGHLTKTGLGSFADPRHGGGRLNRRTREEIVHLVRPAGSEALLIRGFALDYGLIGVGFMAETGEIAMTRESLTIARAVRKTGGIVIGQLDHLGTLAKPRPGQVIAPDNAVDVLIAADPRDRGIETFASPAAFNPAHPPT
jgi:propionate CoA-transferase